MGVHSSVGPPVNCSISLKDDPRERLLFESFPEQGISEGYNTRFRYQGSSGRASQSKKAFYGGGDFAPFRLELIFVAGLHDSQDFLRGGITPFSPTANDRRTGQPNSGNSFSSPQKAAEMDFKLQRMEQKVRWLQATCFPRRDVPRTQNVKDLISEGDPPRILITFGQFLVIEGVVEDWTVQWKPPFHPDTARPYVAEVAFTVKRLSDFYPDWYDVQQVRFKKTSQPSLFSVIGEVQRSAAEALQQTANQVITPNSVGATTNPFDVVENVNQFTGQSSDVSFDGASNPNVVSEINQAINNGAAPGSFGISFTPVE